jgi:hypothetical protein
MHRNLLHSPVRAVAGERQTLGSAGDIVNSHSLPDLVDALLALTPGGPVAEQVQRTIESSLMTALKVGGREAGEFQVETLVAHGYSLKRIPPLPCMWRVATPAPRVLEIWFTGGDKPVVAAVSYRVGKPWGSKAQQSAAERQAEFYRRYDQLGHEESDLSRDDRLLKLIAEFEADVNNGGFGQYLQNKGETRARELLEYLSAVGANRTARWLASALKSPSEAATLSRLDDEFCRRAEDLASLVMTHLKRTC